ncbi:MAG: MerR family transcriptional regulator [Bacillota bacterium]
MPMTVKQVAELSGVTVRTLHYYDQIGLFRPSAHSDGGYRLYDEAALMRLQQILFYREIGLPLKEIRSIIDDRNFDAAEALRAHRRELIERRTRQSLLICTIDRTLMAMEGGTPLSAQELFDGFGKQKVEENERKYGAEIRKRYGDELVDKSNAVIAGMNRQEYESLQKEGAEIYKDLTKLMHMEPEAQPVQEAITRFAAYIRRFGEYPDEALMGLGDMYVDDVRFKAFFEGIAPGLAEFIRDALHAKLEPES